MESEAKTIWQNQQKNIALQLGATKERHGVVSLTTGESHPNAVREPYFLMNIYRVLADKKLWTIARDEPFTADWREDGLTLHWQPGETLPLEMRADYRVEDNGDLTLDFWVRAARDLEDLEISVSSYFDFAYEPYGVLDIVSQDEQRQLQPQLWKAEDQTFVRGHYIHLPRDDKGTLLRLDGRWNNAEGKTIAPAVYGPQFAWPVAVMAAPNLKNENGEQGVTIVQNATRAACAAISLTYSSDNEKDSIRNHNATYFSLFGESLKSGEERQATLRQSVLRGAPTLENIEAAMLQS
jgi:hypothetical protein